MSRARAFTFTWHNFDENTEAYLQALDCQYIVYGYEICPDTQRPHLQGYVYFTNARSFEAVRKIFPNQHIEIARGAPEQNFDYCTKDGNFFEHGVRPLSDKQKGVNERERFKIARKAAEEGKFSEIPDDIYIRYYGAIKRIRIEDSAAAPATDIKVLRPWQKELKTKLDGPIHPRKIYWYTDLTGGTGKTEFAKWAAVNMQAHIVHNAKTADIAYGLPLNPKIVIFDYTRSMEAHVNYGVLEAIKNGMVFSSKYESRMKCFAKPHVVVFSNFEPDLSKLSEDRWEVTNL